MNESAEREVSDESQFDEQKNVIDESRSDEPPASRGHWKIRLGVLCTMLVLALIGMGLTQASESGAWEYWLFVVVVYAGLGIWRGARSAACRRRTRRLQRSRRAHLATLYRSTRRLGEPNLPLRRGPSDRERAHDLQRRQHGSVSSLHFLVRACGSLDGP